MSTQATFTFEGITLSASSDGFRETICESLQEHVNTAIKDLKKEQTEVTREKILEKVELAIRRDADIDFRMWQISDEKKGTYSYILDSDFIVKDAIEKELFTFDITEKHGRIVKTFEVEAEDVDKAMEEAEEVLTDFIEELCLEGPTSDLH